MWWMLTRTTEMLRAASRKLKELHIKEAAFTQDHALHPMTEPCETEKSCPPAVNLIIRNLEV